MSENLMNQTSELYSHSNKYYPREGNSSITTSVTIRVTPEHYHLWSWGILWLGFLFGISLAVYQIRIESHWFATSGRRDVEQGQSDGESISIADWTRNRFRRSLLLAMVCRGFMIPIQLWSSPLWVQFVADTLPEMAFASAWTLLVIFFVQLFVQLVGGTGSTTSPGLAIQITAYVVYVMLILTYMWNAVASILLYALLCCIYAVLFGITLYFCPRLLSLLQPSLLRHSGLASRLAACCILCLIVFGCRTFGFARKVVLPPRRVSWWWQYGWLELIPATTFLLMMHPNSNRSGVVGVSQSSTPPTNKEATSHRREDSNGSRRSGESAPLVNKSSAGTVLYGSSSAPPSS